MSEKNKDCQCTECQDACRHKPGWFKPGEAEKAAELVGQTLPEFFKKSLAVDWYEADGDEAGGDVFLLAPVLKFEEAGTEYPGNPKGECGLFEDGKCTIHAAKPFQCRDYHHTNKDDKPNTNPELATAWKDHQEQIEELLGRTPISEPYSGGGPFGLW